VLPSIRDAVGAPVPGISGVRQVQPPAGFREVLRNLRVRPTTSGLPAPGAVATVRQAAPARAARVLPAPGGVMDRRPAGLRAGDHAIAARPVAGAAAETGRARLAGPAQVPAAQWQARLAAMRPDHSRPAGTVRPLRGEARQALVQAIEVASEHAGLDPALSVAVARAESSLDPTARSFDGKSVGTFQVTHATAAEMRRKIGRGDVERPPGHDDVALGVGYLRYLHDLFSESRRLGRGLETVAIGDADERRLFAVAAYNAGEGRVAQAQARAERAGLDPTRFAHVKPFLPSITQTYVERVRRFAGEESSAPT